ncbi:MAG: hypothetical protein AB2421_19200 [Thermotaleaceae bacterium]
MSKHIEVIYNILPLLSTIEEGLNHIKNQLSELRYEESFALIQDAMMGIASIESALQPMESQFKELQDSDMIKKKQDLNQYMSTVVNLYENKKYKELEKKVNLVLGAFIVWRESIEQIVRPQIIS